VLAQVTNSPDLWQFLARSKDAFSSVESIFKVLAIAVGGYWAYRTFHRRRERYPKAKVTHTLSHWATSENQRLLRVALNINNDGEVLLKASSGFTWIQQMKPWPAELLKSAQPNGGSAEYNETQIRWPLIAEKQFSQEREIEPKESEEIQMDFVIDKWYEQVLVYSFIENAAKPGRHLGWEVTSIVEFDAEKQQSTALMSQQISDKRQAHAKPRPAPASPPTAAKTSAPQTQTRPSTPAPTKGNK
jgi:hypothetical protein